MTSWVFNLASGVINVYNFFDDPLVLITQQKKLECHREDSSGSRLCPVYVKPIKEAFYLSFADNVSMKWEGGRDFTLNTPSRWEDTYSRSKARWVAEAGLAPKDTLHFRYHGNRPMGSVGNASGHAGGLTVNFFTGLSVQSSEGGMKCLVTRAFNQFHPSWTMQDGIYDIDKFKGDFSVNFQIMLQDREIIFQKGEPFAALFFYKEVEPSVTIFPYSESEEAWKESFGFYQRKVDGCPYQQNLAKEKLVVTFDAPEAEILNEAHPPSKEDLETLIRSSRRMSPEEAKASGAAFWSEFTS